MTNDDLLSIGDLADRTGLSPDTIRVWERRYGEPRAVRLPSGHRRYTGEHVRRLRRIAEGVAQGHRPSRLLPLTDAELDRLLEPEPAPTGEADLAPLLEHVLAYDRAALRAALLAHWSGRGVLEFLAETIAPLAERVGRGWADGELDVRHEHCMSEVFEDVLRSLRMGEELKGTARTGARVLLTTLSGEKHDLGLQMAALVAVASGAAVRLLGTETPIPEILAAARDLDAHAVALSVSLATGGPSTDRELRELRERLPAAVALVAGGAGARRSRRGRKGIVYCSDFASFRAALERLRPDSPAGP